MQTETHPLEPYLPHGSKLLMLGSFPPPRARWSMDFYYPNLRNDMWRILGIVFFGDREHFLTPDRRHFDRERIIAFTSEKGIALSDTATEVVRLKGNASDQFLRITGTLDLREVLGRIPSCRAVATTGQKATETLLGITGGVEPGVGSFGGFVFEGRAMRHYRMPSSSRAYPKSIEEKALQYAAMFRDMGLV